MRKLKGTLTIVAVAGLLAMATTAAAAKARNKHTAASAGVYDGLWSVSIRTHTGPCDVSYRYPARIVGGKIVQDGSDHGYRISGNVVSSGLIAVTVSRGVGSATGYGRLRGGSGGGRWRTGGNECSGTWTAMRRGGV